MSVTVRSGRRSAKRTTLPFSGIGRADLIRRIVGSKTSAHRPCSGDIAEHWRRPTLPRFSCGCAPGLVRGEAWVVAGRSAESAVDVPRDGDCAGALFGKKVDATVTPRVGLAKYARLEAEGAVHVNPTVAHVCRWRKPFLPEKRRHDRSGLSRANSKHVWRGAPEPSEPEGCTRPVRAEVEVEAVATGHLGAARLSRPRTMGAE